MKRFGWLILGCLISCAPKADLSEPVAKADWPYPGYKPLHQCSVDQNDEAANPWQLWVLVPETARAPTEGRQDVYISIARGAPVRSFCGEKKDAKNKTVYSCWFSGGGLSLVWPENADYEHAKVSLIRKKLFSPLTAGHKEIQCRRAGGETQVSMIGDDT